MTLFGRKNPTMTRIVQREQPPEECTLDPAEVQAALASVLEKRRWEPAREQFKGFGSPPGKF